MTNTASSQPLPAPQAGLYREPGNHAHYLEMTLRDGIAAEDIKHALALALLQDLDTHIALAFGSQGWDQLQPDWRPADLQPFTTLTAKHQMPATQADLLFWIHGEDRGEVMAAAIHIGQSMAAVADVQLDISGFKNRESRDLTGFVDGTANPKEEKRIDAAQIPAGQPGAGGSYVFSQQWRHNLQGFQQLTTEQQEAVIGRTKRDNIELEGDAMPVDSHVSRTDVKVDGVGMKIYRRSTPYYSSAEDRGLYFISFACELKRISIQLERMVGASDDGIADQLMGYSQPLTGSYWFMPAQADLMQLLKEQGAGVAEADD